MANFIKKFTSVRFLVAAAFLMIASLMTANPASAGIFICNDTGGKIDVAIGWREGNNWSSKGWFTVAPRECTYPLAGAMENQTFYYYARTPDSTLEWKEGAESAHFCTSNNRFYYSYAVDPPCGGYSFRKVVMDEPDQYTLRLTESQMDPKQAALNCWNTAPDGRDAFIKCWTRNAATVTQRKILDCLDQSGTYASFAVCSANGSLNRDAANVADCVSKYYTTSGSDLAVCLSNNRLSQQDARLLNCAVRSQGDIGSMGSCALLGQITPEQQQLVACVATNRGSYTNMALCAAGSYVSPEQRRVADCVVRNQASYIGMGVCAAAGNSLTPEQQVFVQCAVTTGGQPYAFAGCVGTQFTLNELQKCLTQGIGGSGCFGTNNEATKFVRNAWKDVTQGPGPSNDLVGRDGAVIRTVRNVVTGPINDVMHGEIGGSSASVWRKAGLPRIRF